MSRLILVLPLGAAIGLTGCGACRTSNFVAERPHTCARCLDSVQPPRYPAYAGPPPGRQNYAAVPGLPPRQNHAAIPEPSRPLPSDGPGPRVEEGAATFVPPSSDVPPPPPSSMDRPPPSSFEDGVPSTSPQSPSGSGITLGPPGPIRSDSLSPSTDRTKEPPLANVPGNGELRANDLPLSIDLPGFAIAAPGVATGIKPFPDGITWLAENGYKSVLHLRGPEDDIAAAQRMFEKKGIKYTSIEASPARLSRDLYDSFVRMVNDSSNHPLFVYDKDGSVAGGLWWLYYRVEKNESDENARAQAQRFGLRFDDDPEHQAMVIAVQNLLSQLKP